MNRLAIVGSGDMGQLIAYHAEEDNHYQVVGFFDDFKKVNDYAGKYPVIGNISDSFNLYEKGYFDHIIIAIGYKHFFFRKKVYEKIKNNIPLGKIIHTNSYVASSCNIGDGVVILPGCTLDNNVSVEDNVFINTSVAIAHDTIIRAHTFLSPRVAVAGFVDIGVCCNIGINSTIIDNIKIVDGVQTGGGTVVVKNILSSGLYVGVPAKLLKNI